MADHDTRDAGPQYGLHTRRCPAEVVTGFQSDVHRGFARRFARSVQGHYLGVGFSGPRMPALPHDLAILSDHGSHQRVRRNRIPPALGEAAGKIHHRIPQHVFLSPIRTLTVGAGLRLESEPSPAQPQKGLAGSPGVGAVREPPLHPGSPPVREFHPPPKVSNETLSHRLNFNKETLRVSASQHFSRSARMSVAPPPTTTRLPCKTLHRDSYPVNYREREC